MSNLNVVILQGNLVDNPKLVGKEENPVARFTIANNTGFGEYSETTYMDCVAFGKVAKVISEHVGKGKQILVKGKIMQSRWEDKDGNRRTKHELKVDQIEGFFFVGNATKTTSTEESSIDEQQEPVSAKPMTKKSGKLF